MALKQSSAHAPRFSAGLHRFAILIALSTFMLIFAGGLVTSTGSALAVPDWPLSFGKFFPRMEGGVLYEHGHRMIAGAVSILTLILAIWAWRREPRRWVRNGAIAAIGLILFQAVLGGLTVLFLLPLPIAVAHAATAQAFFCLIVALSLFTNPAWERLPRIAELDQKPATTTLAALTTAIIYLQILVGALMRHMGAGLAIPDFPLAFGGLVPPLDSALVVVNFAHRCGAVVVTAMVVWTVVRVVKEYRDQPLLRRPALAMVTLLSLQILLGALTIWTKKAVLPSTAHVAIGALVLATSLVLTLRARRLLETQVARQAAPAVERGARAREVIA